MVEGDLSAKGNPGFWAFPRQMLERMRLVNEQKYAAIHEKRFLSEVTCYPVFITIRNNRWRHG